MNKVYSSESIKKNAEQEPQLFIEWHSNDLPSIIKESEDLYYQYSYEGKRKNPDHQLMCSISVKYSILRDYLVSLEQSNNLPHDISRRLEKLRLSPQPDKDRIRKCCDKETDQINNKDDVFDSGVFSRHGFYGGVYDNSANMGEFVREQHSIPQPSIRNQSAVMTTTNYSTTNNNQNRRHSLPNPTLPRHSFYGMSNTYADTTSRPGVYDQPTATSYQTHILNTPTVSQTYIYNTPTVIQTQVYNTPTANQTKVYNIPTVTYPDPPVLPKFGYQNTFSCCQDILSQLDFSKIPDYPSISFGATDKKSVDIGDIR